MSCRIEQCLEAVRQVFEGEITRAEVQRLTNIKKAFIATALMLMFPEHYLDAEGAVRPPLYRTLDKIFNRGIKAEDRATYASDVVTAMKTYGLHTPDRPGRGGEKKLTLTPTRELAELIDRLDRTPAIMAFQAAISPSSVAVGA